MKLNNVTKKLPKYLHKFIVKQPYEEYTAQNQAVWRYVMRLNISCLKKIAHSCYIDGLNKTGIVEDFIPEMEGMNRFYKTLVGQLFLSMVLFLLMHLWNFNPIMF